LDRRLGRGQRGGGGGNRALGIAAGSSLVLRPVLAGGLGALAGVERQVQRHPVVAFADRVVRALEGVGGGGEFFAGVMRRAGAARGINGGLRVLEFLVGRASATTARERRDEAQRGQQAAERTHVMSIRRTAGGNGDRPRTPAHGWQHTRAILTNDRPREKLLRHGAAALGDNELMALVIGNGSGQS